MSRPDQGGASLRAVLALPHARGLFAAGAFARLPYGLLPLPLLLALREAAGSYGSAGLTVGVYSLVIAVLGPYRARLAERRPAALPWLAAGFAVLLGLVALLVALHAGWVAELPAPVAALFAPPVGSLVRTRWSLLAGTGAGDGTDAGADADSLRQAALSVDTAAESTVFALGPALAGALLTVVTAPAALGLCAGTFALGFLALAAVFRRVPAPPVARPGADGSVPDTPRVPLRSALFASVLLAVLAAGATGAQAELAAVAAWGAGTAGPLLTLFSVGAVLGGLGYGRRAWRRTPHRRLPGLVALAAGSQALVTLCFAPAGAAAGLLLGGAAEDCLLITAFLLVEELVPEGARTEGGAWVNAAFNLGVAGGSALGGALLGAPSGARGVFGFGAVLLLAVLPLLALVRGPRPAPQPEPGSEFEPEFEPGSESQPEAQSEWSGSRL